MNATMSSRLRTQGGTLGGLQDAAGDSRGVALLFTLFVVFALGMMLFGFLFLSQNEASFASFDRNRVEALALAESGAQEALNRVNNTQIFPAAGTTWQNSLATNSSVSPGGAGTMTIQAALQSNSSVTPILSHATFNNIERDVRIFVAAVYKSGLGRIIYGQQVTFPGDASPITGDTYSATLVSYQNLQHGTQCAAGATATNLVAPQVFAGAYITAGGGSPITMACGQTTSASGTWTSECASDPTRSEVAPTPCSRATISGQPLPVNWHPGTPAGMDSAPFTTVVNAAVLPSGVTVVQATQNGVGATYSPWGYTPSYWSTKPTTNGKVMLVVATQPFCVNTSAGTVTLPAPLVTGTCALGSTKYGFQVSGTPFTTRFVDWGMVQDDLSRGVPQTFFSAPVGCSGSACAASGKANGIRYIPEPPNINVIAHRCDVVFASPGTNVFDDTNGDGYTCPAPISVINSGSVTFSGLKSSPESLVVDNGTSGGTVSIFPSVPGSPTLNCSNVNFANYNYGQILATGPINLQGNAALSGLVYSDGQITVTNILPYQGALISNGNTNQPVDITGTANYCGGTANPIVTTLFFTYRVVSWQDRPLNQP